MSVTDMDQLREEREALGLDPQNGGSSLSIADRVDQADDLDPLEQAELFPKGVLDTDGKIQLKNLIRANESVEITASLMTAEVPLRGGLVDPRKEGKVIVSFEAAKYIPVPQRKGEPGDKQLTGWKIRCQLRPTYVEPIEGAYFSREQVLSILDQVGVPRSSDRVAELLG